MACLSKTSVSFGSKRTNRVLVGQLALAAIAWRGLADWSFPGALVALGVLGIAVLEVRG
jgi:hypothetical protein